MLNEWAWMGLFEVPYHAYKSSLLSASFFGLFCLNYGLVLAAPQTPCEPAFLSTVAAGETLN